MLEEGMETVMEKGLLAMVESSSRWLDARRKRKRRKMGAIAGRSALSLGASRVVLRLCLRTQAAQGVKACWISCGAAGTAVSTELKGVTLSLLGTTGLLATFGGPHQNTQPTY
jgi:hypothetical protein